jgi:choline dehydrogenase
MGSVLDAELRVKGVAGLRVADASAFPHITSGDANAPAMLVGEMLSAFLKKQYQLSAH